MRAAARLVATDNLKSGARGTPGGCSEGSMYTSKMYDDACHVTNSVLKLRNDGLEQGPQDTSTPRSERKEHVSISWADEEHEDSKAIEEYLATVEAVKTGADGGMKASSQASSVPSETKAVKPDHGNRIGEGHVSNNIGFNPLLRNRSAPVRQTSNREETRPATVTRGAEGGSGRATKEEVGERQKAGKGQGGIGARPKTGSITGESVPTPLFCVESTEQPANEPQNKSYAEAAGGEGDWEKPEDRKRKRNKSSPRNLAPIRAARVKPQKEIFVRGLAKDDYNSAADMEDAMRMYCVDRGMSVTYIKAMKDRYKTDVANCRIIINEEDGQRALDPHFWPENITVREWYTNPRERSTSVGQKE